MAGQGRHVVGMAALAAAVLAVTASVAAAAFFNDTARGEKPTVTPELLILEPSKPVVHIGEPLVIRVAFKNLSYHPDMRTGNAAATLGMTSQVTEDGVVRGHIHAYVQKIGAESNRASPFCIFEMTDLVEMNGYNGVAERTCGEIAEPGDYRIVVDTNTDSHDGVYKAHPQELPASDAVRVKARGDQDG